MPSGSKKRKAAKKKKEKEAAHHHHHQHRHHHHPHSVDVHSHGDDDLKHHDDDKESDAEEVSSPVWQEQSDAEEVSSPVWQEHPNHHHQITDGEKEEENKSFVGAKENNKATQTATGEEQGVENKQEPKPAESQLNSKNRIVDDFEPQKEANGGVLLQRLDKECVSPIETDPKPDSDEVSSKNEIEPDNRTAITENVPSRIEDNDGVFSQSVDEEDVVQIEIESKPDCDELNNETAMVRNVEPQKEGTDEVLLRSIEERSVFEIKTDPKPSDQLNRSNVIMENVEPQKEAGDGTMLQSVDQGGVAQIEADLKTVDVPEIKNVTFEHAEPLKETTDGDLSQIQNEESHVIDKTIFAADNSHLVNSSEAVNPLSEGLTQVTNSIEVGDNHSSFMEIGSADEKDKAKLSDEKTNDKSVSADSNEEKKENGEKEVILQERNCMMSPAYVDFRLDYREDKTIVKTDDSMATSDAKISASREIGENLKVSYNVPAIETANGADSSHSTNDVEHLRDPEVPKSSDCEPPMTSGPRTVQRTSWMSCCGLFEVFAGSNSNSGNEAAFADPGKVMECWWGQSSRRSL